MRKLLYSKRNTNGVDRVELMSDIRKDSESSFFSNEMNDIADTNDLGLNNLICPLCLKFIYKCTTPICGHSFCERCLDEYLIIRKVSLYY